MLSAFCFLAGGLKALRLPEGDCLLVFLDCSERNTVISHTLECGTHVGKDARADSATLHIALHHESADELNRKSDGWSIEKEFEGEYLIRDNNGPPH